MNLRAYAEYRCDRVGVQYASFNVIYEVLERDHWSCRWCGVSTPKEKRGSRDDDAPEVDHIWPLGVVRNGLKSPGHIPENCCCACRKCNSKRRNEIGEGAPPGVPVESVPERKRLGLSPQERSELFGIFWRELFGRLEYQKTKSDLGWLRWQGKWYNFHRYKKSPSGEQQSSQPLVHDLPSRKFRNSVLNPMPKWARFSDGSYGWMKAIEPPQ
jgi:hypothetical protein